MCRNTRGNALACRRTCFVPVVCVVVEHCSVQGRPLFCVAAIGATAVIMVVQAMRVRPGVRSDEAGRGRRLLRRDTRNLRRGLCGLGIYADHPRRCA